MRAFLLLLAILAAPAYADFMLVDERGEVPQLAGPVAALNARIRTDRITLIVVRPCGVVNAMYGRNDGNVTICSELVSHIYGRAGKDAASGGVSREVVEENALGELLFFLYHEIGHALIDHYSIPALGGQEAAADMFAGYMMMKTGNPGMYLGAMNAFAESRYARQVIKGGMLSEAHGLPAQRRANLACWGYGRDPKIFGSIVAYQKMSEHRLRGCANEYREMMRDTETAFRPAWR